MYTINGVPLKGSIDSVFEQIMIYLKENRLLIINQDSIPITEFEVLRILESNDNYDFKTKPVNEIEDELIKELIEYINKIESFDLDVFYNGNYSLIINSFVEITQSILELQKVSEYFKIPLMTQEEISDIASTGLSKAENGDFDYLSDVIEFELIPRLIEFKTKILERQQH